MIDGRSEWSKDLVVAIIVIQVDDNIWHLRDQALQNLTLHRREIKKPIQHQ